MDTTRREMLTKMAVGAAVASLPSAAQAATGSPPSRTVVSGLFLNDGDAPWWLIAPYHQGSALALGWSVQGLSGVDRGAAVLELVHVSGDVARVHVCSHDGQPRGLASTALVDLVLMDGGDGQTPTDEDIGRVLLGLAEQIRTNELAPDGDLGPIARMMTHPDRVIRYGAETLG